MLAVAKRLPVKVRHSTRKTVARVPQRHRNHRHIAYHHHGPRKIIHVARRPSAPPRKEVGGIAINKEVDCQKALEEAQRLIDGRDADQADKYLKDSLEVDPRNPCVRDNIVKLSVCRAKKHLECNENECAARKAREALFLEPDNPDATDVLDNAFRQAGLSPKDPQTRMEVGSCLADSKRYVGAIVEYQQALNIVPSAQANFGAGNAALKTGLKQMALRYFQQGLAMDPTNGAIHRTSGFLQQSLGNLSGAGQSFAQALLLNPKDVLAGEGLTGMLKRQIGLNKGGVKTRLQLVKAYLLSGLTSQAQAEFARLGKVDPDFNDWPSFASAQMQNIDLERGLIQAQNAASQLQLTSVAGFDEAGPQPSALPLGQAGNGTPVRVGSRICPCH